MVRRLLAAAASAALVVTLASCSTEEPESTSTSIPSETTPAEVDVTDQFAAVDVVTRAYELAGEPDRVSIETTITDPRGDAGSPEAQQAIEVCSTAVTLGYPHVTVYEADGSTFVVAGHPAYGDDCTEV